MTKHVTIILHRDELNYDIVSVLHLMSDALSADEQKHVKHLYNDVLEGENIYRTMRYTNRAYYECVELLHDLTQVPVSQESTLDNTPGAPESYEMYLSVNEDFSKGQVQLLKDLLHDYIVQYAVNQWLTLILAQNRSECAENLYEIRHRITQIADNQSKVGRIKAFFGGESTH